MKMMVKPGLPDLARQKKGPVLLAIYIFFWAAILICIATAGWVITWKMLQIPAMYPPFADMRTVQGALASLAAGYDPQFNNPGDQWGRAMNYPAIWIHIARFFQFGNENHFIVFVSSCVLGYLCACYALLKRTPSVYLLLAMFSGASLLAVERGNNDLVIFLLVALALHVRRDWARSAIVLLAVILKFYPVFAVYGLLRKKIRYLVMSAALAAVYLMTRVSEMMVIKAGNTASGNLSYGLSLDAKQLSVLLVVLGLIGYLLRRKGVPGRLCANDSGEYEREMFIVGGSVFVATFVLAMNWDYRLVFLLFCLPYFLTLRSRFLLHASSIVVLLTMNVLLLGSIGQFWVSVAHVGKYFLFVVVFIALVYELLPKATIVRANLSGN